MKNLAIAIIIVSVAVLFASIHNIIQTYQIDKLQKEVRCLNQGRVYVGDNFCAE